RKQQAACIPGNTRRPKPRISTEEIAELRRDQAADRATKVDIEAQPLRLLAKLAGALQRRLAIRIKREREIEVLERALTLEPQGKGRTPLDVQGIRENAVLRL